MKTVLLIDDNADIRENTGEILELAGYKILLAANGKEGVNLALAEKPDIIVCDVMMPELDGYGVIHMLQKHPDTQSIPFIFLTARSERSDIRKGMEVGADDYIIKPFSGTELLNAIEERLKKADAIRDELLGDFRGLADMVKEHASKTVKETFEENQDSRRFRKNERIYIEGRHPDKLYYVVAGKVKIYMTNEQGKELIAEVCRAGDFFGYSALLEGVPYRESAEAIEECEISSIAAEVFEELMSDNPAVTHEFVKLLAGNVYEKTEQLLSVAYNSLRKKVANALIVMSKKYSTADEPAKPMHINRDVLAAIAGTAKESLVRTLGEFRDENLIEIHEGNIRVLQEKKLANLRN